MGAFGKFLEYSLPTADVLRSLNFYRSLGFTELITSDIRPWHYAVVTDGSIVIGLHGEGISEPALAFVRPNLAQQVRAMEAAGQEFEFSHLGSDEFNEAALRSPDGHLIVMVEARTYSPGTFGSAPASLLGRCTEVTLSCRDPGASRAFFEAGGFLPVDDDAGQDAVRLKAAGITMGLREPLAGMAATLRFAADDPRRVLRQLEQEQLSWEWTAVGRIIRAPEGTRLVLPG